MDYDLNLMKLFGRFVLASERHPGLSFAKFAREHEKSGNGMQVSRKMQTLEKQLDTLLFVRSLKHGATDEVIEQTTTARQIDSTKRAAIMAEARGERRLKAGTRTTEVTQVGRIWADFATVLVVQEQLCLFATGHRKAAYRLQWPKTGIGFRRAVLTEVQSRGDEAPKVDSSFATVMREFGNAHALVMDYLDHRGVPTAFVAAALCREGPPERAERYEREASERAAADRSTNDE